MFPNIKALGLPFVRGTGSGNGVALLTAAFSADGNGVVKGLRSGIGGMTFARNSAATITDFEGLVNDAIANELRFNRLRRVRNKLPESNNFADGAWAVSGVTKNGVITGGGPNGEDAYSITFNSTTTSYIVGTDAAPNGGPSCFSIWARTDTGTSSVRIRVGTPAMISGDISIDETWKRITYTFAAPVGNNARGLTNNVAGDTGTIYICNAQSECVSGRANQNPGEYVSNGELTGDFHGVGVDGIKYFDYENGNTVTSNVVTEATGSDISTDWHALLELAATNECLYSEDLSNAAWVATNITKSTDGVTLPNGLSGTAETLTSTAANGTLLQTITLASQANVFSVYLQRKTGTGNIDITLDNGVSWSTKSLTGVGTWDRVDVSGAAAANPIVGVRIVTSGDAIQMWGAQLEAGAVPTSYVSTTAASTTRIADDATPFAQITGNFNQAQGALIMDWVPQQDYTNKAAVNNGLVSLDAGADNLLYTKATAGVVSSTDDTSVTDTTVNWSRGNRYRIGLRWKTGGTFSISWRDITGAGAWAVWSSNSYDGGFNAGTDINIFVSGLGDGFRDLFIYGSDVGEAWIEDGF